MLHVHRAERADALVEALADLLADPPADPFAREVVAVPTRGMERWLTQRMSARLGAAPGRADGVCANVDFPSPAPPRRRRGRDRVRHRRRDGSVAARARRSGRCSTSSTGCLDEPWIATLADAPRRHRRRAADPARRARRFAVVRHLADLFDRYALHRPEMVRAWAAARRGRHRRRRCADCRWQAELWRAPARAHRACPSPAERIDGGVRARSATTPPLLDLPERVLALRPHPAPGRPPRRAARAGRGT